MKITRQLATCTTSDGSVLVLQEHDGHFYLRVDGVQLMSTTASSSEQTMAELACASLPPRARILIGGLGFGFTLRRVLELAPADAVVEVAELLPEIVEWNREFLREVNGVLLEDPRVVVRLGDVGETLKGPERYHAILLDVDNSPDPLVQHANARLYNRAGVQRAKGVLQRGGRIVYWSANQDRGFARVVEGVFGNVECVGAKAYPKAKRFTHTLFVAMK